MPRVVVTAAASRGIARCVRFLVERDATAAGRAAKAIERRLAVLRSNPGIGRPVPERPEQRELVIPFGRSGYVALYRFDPASDVVAILAFRHQREAGY